jgi:hypothetical protein
MNKSLVQLGCIMADFGRMKNPNSEAPKLVKEWLAEIGSKGGKKGSSSDKRRAALVRWAKPGARKTISPSTTPGE